MPSVVNSGHDSEGDIKSLCGRRGLLGLLKSLCDFAIGTQD